MAVSSVRRRSTRQKERLRLPRRSGTCWDMSSSSPAGSTALASRRPPRCTTQVAGDQLTYATTSLLFLVDFLAGRRPSEDALADALALEQAIDAAPRPTPPSVVQALRLMYLDRIDEAREAFAHALRRAANRGDEEMVEAVRFHSARLELRAGDWARAAELTDQISELAGQDLGHRSGLRAWIRAQVAAYEGDESASAYAADAVTAGGGLGSGSEMQALLGFLELSRGTP